MAKAITYCLLVVGLINLAPVFGVISAAKLESAYSVTLAGNDLAILMRHRALLFGILGAFIIYSAFNPHYQLAAMIMGNIPMALIGSVIAMWLAGISLSVASLVGFITLTGIATRNGILKISHYINLCKFEGEHFSQAMIIRGSLERLTPVLMTALTAALALVPLLLAADAPGKEILHPVAVVIFGGLIISTLLDTLLTPLMLCLFGQKPLQRLLPEKNQTAF